MVSFSALLLPPAAAQAADPRCVIRSAIAEAHTPAVLHERRLDAGPDFGHPDMGVLRHRRTRCIKISDLGSWVGRVNLT